MSKDMVTVSLLDEGLPFNEIMPAIRDMLLSTDVVLGGVTLPITEEGYAGLAFEIRVVRHGPHTQVH